MSVRISGGYQIRESGRTTLFTPDSTEAKSLKRPFIFWKDGKLFHCLQQMFVVPVYFRKLYKTLCH
jgi:hypothetical protein